MIALKVERKETKRDNGNSPYREIKGGVLEIQKRVMRRVVLWCVSHRNKRTVLVRAERRIKRPCCTCLEKAFNIFCSLSTLSFCLLHSLRKSKWEKGKRKGEDGEGKKRKKKKRDRQEEGKEENNYPSVCVSTLAFSFRSEFATKKKEKMRRENREKWEERERKKTEKTTKKKHKKNKLGKRNKQTKRRKRREEREWEDHIPPKKLQKNKNSNKLWVW